MGDGQEKDAKAHLRRVKSTTSAEQLMQQEAKKRSRRPDKPYKKIYNMPSEIISCICKPN